MSARRRKYFNQPTTIDGTRFDSRREADAYVKLKALQQAGEIYDLRLQVPYRFWINGVLVATYRADFAWRERKTGELVVADAKGVRTPVYRLKAKLMQAVYGITVREL